MYETKKCWRIKKNWLHFLFWLDFNENLSENIIFCCGNFHEFQIKGLYSLIVFASFGKNKNNKETNWVKYNSVCKCTCVRVRSPASKTRYNTAYDGVNVLVPFSQWCFNVCEQVNHIATLDQNKMTTNDHI